MYACADIERIARRDTAVGMQRDIRLEVSAADVPECRRLADGFKAIVLPRLSEIYPSSFVIGAEPLDSINLIG